MITVIEYLPLSNISNTTIIGKIYLIGELKFLATNVQITFINPIQAQITQILRATRGASEVGGTCQVIVLMKPNPAVTAAKSNPQQHV